MSGVCPARREGHSKPISARARLNLEAAEMEEKEEEEEEEADDHFKKVRRGAM